MDRINSNIQVSAGLDATDYVAGVKTVGVANDALIKDYKSSIGEMNSVAQAGLAKTTSIFKTQGANASSAFLGALSGGLLGGGIAGAVSGIASVIGTALNDAIKSIADLNDQAAALGITAEALYSLEKAFSDLGVSSDKVLSTFDSLFKNIRRNTKEFEDYGIATKDAAGNFRDIQSVLNDVSNLLLLLEGSTEQAVVAQKLLGDNWKETIELLRVGQTELNKTTEVAGKNAKKMTEASKALDSFGDDISELGGDLKELAGWFLVAGNAALKFTSNITGQLSTLQAINKAAKEKADREAKVAGAAGKTTDKELAAVLLTQAQLKKRNEQRAKDAVANQKLEDEAFKKSQASAKAASDAADKASKDAERLAKEQAKVRAEGLKLITSITDALKEQIQVTDDLLNYGQDYADFQASLRKVDVEREKSITDLNKALKEGAIDLKEYNKALDAANKLAASNKDSITKSETNRVLNPLRAIDLDQKAIDSSKGLFGKEALDAIDEFYIRQEALNISTDYYNSLVQGGAEANVEGVNTMTDALVAQTVAQKNAIDQMKKDQADREALAQGITDSIGGAFESIISGSESASEALRKMGVEVAKLIIQFYLLKALNTAFGISTATAGTQGAAPNSLSYSGGSSSSPSIKIYNYSSTPGGIQAKSNSNGDIDIIVGRMTQSINRGGNSFDQALRRTYGLQRVGV